MNYVFLAGVILSAMVCLGEDSYVIHFDRVNVLRASDTNWTIGFLESNKHANIEQYVVTTRINQKYYDFFGGTNEHPTEVSARWENRTIWCMPHPNGTYAEFFVETNVNRDQVLRLRTAVEAQKVLGPPGVRAGPYSHGHVLNIWRSFDGDKTATELILGFRRGEVDFIGVRNGTVSRSSHPPEPSRSDKSPVTNSDFKASP